LRAARRGRCGDHRGNPTDAAGAASMTTIAETPGPLRARKIWPLQLDAGVAGLMVLIAICALVVMPPFFYLIKSSFTVQLPGFRTAFGLDNYQRVIEISGLRLWGATVGFALGSSVMSIFLGFSAAWLLARTNVPFRQ